MADDEESPLLEDPRLITPGPNDLIIADEDNGDDLNQNSLLDAKEQLEEPQLDFMKVDEEELELQDEVMEEDESNFMEKIEHIEEGLSSQKESFDDNQVDPAEMEDAVVERNEEVMETSECNVEGTSSERVHNKDEAEEPNIEATSYGSLIDEKIPPMTPEPKAEVQDRAQGPECEYETREINGLVLKVPKWEVELAKKFGFNPFCYIQQDNKISLPISEPKEEKIKVQKKEKKRKKLDEVPVEPRKRKRSKTETPTPTTSSVSSLKPPTKKIKLISESCKVCGKSMKDREFLPDRGTFYCSTKCITKKVISLMKTMTENDELFLMDRKGRKYAGEVPPLKKLEAFLLRDPSFEPVIRERQREAGDSMGAVRRQIREIVQKVFTDRFKFHDIYNTHRAKELGFQVEYDLFNEYKNVRDENYKSWFRLFIRCVKNCGKTFLDVLIENPLKLSELVKLHGKQLEEEVQKIDTIEAGVLDITEEPSTSTVPVEVTKPKKPIEFDLLKKKFKPLDRIPKVELAACDNVPKTALDDILGDAMRDTTSKHGSHLYDANCKICSRKNQDEALKQQRLEKLKKKEQEEREAKEKERELKNKKRMNGRTRDPLERSLRFSDDEGPGGDEGGFDDIDSSDLLTRSPFAHRSSPGVLKREFNGQRSPFYSSNQSPDALMEREKRRESWRNLPKEASTDDKVLANNVIWSGRVCADSYSFDCNLLFVRNRSAYHLKNDMSPIILVKQSVERDYVYKQIDRLKNKWDRHLISLLMQPPQKSSEYQCFVSFYNELNRSDRMVVVSSNRSPSSITDMYFYALPPGQELHPVLDRQDGPGLMDFVKKCGNIMALVVRKATPNRENWRSTDAVQKADSYRGDRDSRRPLSRDENDLRRVGPPPTLAPPSLAPPRTRSPQRSISPEPFYRASPGITTDDFEPDLMNRIGSPRNGSSPIFGVQKRDYSDFMRPAGIREASVKQEKSRSHFLHREGSLLRNDPDPLKLSNISPVTDDNEELKRRSDSPKPSNLTLNALDDLNSLVDVDEFHIRRSRNMNGMREQDEDSWTRALVDDPTKLPLTFESLIAELKHLKKSKNIRLLSEAYYCFHTMKPTEKAAIEELANKAEGELKMEVDLEVKPDLVVERRVESVVQKKLPLPVLPPLPLAEELTKLTKQKEGNSSPNPPPPPPPPALELGEIDSNTQSPIDEIIPPPPPPPQHLDVNWTPPPPPPVPPPVVRGSPLSQPAPTYPLPIHPLSHPMTDMIPPPQAVPPPPFIPSLQGGQVQPVPPPFMGFPSGITYPPPPPFQHSVPIPIRSEPVQIPIDTFDSDGEGYNQEEYSPFKKFKEEKKFPFKHLKPQPHVDPKGRGANNIPLGKGAGEIFGQNGNNEEQGAMEPGPSGEFPENENPLSRLLPQPVMQRPRGGPPQMRGNFRGSPSRGGFNSAGPSMPYPMPVPPRGMMRGRGRGGIIPRGVSMPRGPPCPIRPPGPGMQNPPGFPPRGRGQPRGPPPGRYPMRGFYR
ncbi:unnamed protein product [Bursaphelenchus xylophilus]|uniref:(pine wood nematode) hypothetical protein n=1 Tax=Bursaphelenchus xylophilus TaxID=6326 RepID=A0A1I7SMB1_BURXY|nr:unnamed protein product [Bursaphelenchus xylophilus]CAG9130083.1 unnamed protein product [Bursaphelenchus xylophilus]